MSIWYVFGAFVVGCVVGCFIDMAKVKKVKGILWFERRVAQDFQDQNNELRREIERLRRLKGGEPNGGVCN